MSQRYYPFDSGSGANVNESQWTAMAKHWLNTGVISGVMNNLQVYADSTGLQVKTKTGAAYLEGHYFESDAEEILAIGTADGTNPRIDRVIVKLDWTANTITLAVLQGTPAASPAVPALTQNTSRWEISLAQVRVEAGVATIAADKITDERTYAKITTRPRTTITPLNGWTNASGKQALAYWSDGDGVFHLEGNITGGTVTAGTVIGVLPAGTRPKYDKDVVTAGYLGAAANAVVLLKVWANGNITITSGNSSDIVDINISNVQWRVD